MTTTPFTRRPPVAPAHLRRELAVIEAADRALTGALAGRGVADLHLAVGAVTAVMLRPRTAAEMADEARYDREIAEYDAAVTAHNAAIRDRRQAAVNAREIAAVRKAACPRCFATHPGEC